MQLFEVVAVAVEFDVLLAFPQVGLILPPLALANRHAATLAETLHRALFLPAFELPQQSHILLNSVALLLHLLLQVVYPLRQFKLPHNEGLILAG